MAYGLLVDASARLFGVVQAADRTATEGSVPEDQERYFGLQQLGMPRPHDRMGSLKQEVVGERPSFSTQVLGYIRGGMCVCVCVPRYVEI